jgi:D-arabinose 1-dehydrogenase-like Zn-dependent alcohol dehydrogenase
LENGPDRECRVSNPLQERTPCRLSFVTHADKQLNGRECLYEALDCIAKGKVKVMAEIVPLYNIADAYEKVPNGKVRFRDVINA